LPGRRVHVVWAHAADGASCVYANGKLIGKRRLPSLLSKHWYSGLRLALGNEPYKYKSGPSNDRVWLGTYHRVALYDRALSAAEVRAHYQVGPKPAGGVQKR
jgi:hypothetical protein